MEGIPNFGVVDQQQRIVRGGTPTPDAWVELKVQWSIRRVVRLSTATESNDGPALLAGLEVLPFPMPIFDQIFEPPRTLVMAAVDAVQAGTFVHCGSDSRTQRWLHDHEDYDAGGNDRTGLIIGVYRVVRCGWGKDETWAEMRRYYFHRFLAGLYASWLSFAP